MRAEGSTGSDTGTEERVVQLKRVTIHAAKTSLCRSIEWACAGEEVVISRGTEPVARLVQAQAENLPLVTNDLVFEEYGVTTIW